MPRLLVRTGLIAGVVLLLVSCAPPPQIQRALSESTPPLYKRLLTASELPEGWLLAQSSPDHPLAAGTEPTQAPCDRNYAEELDSGRDRTIASRVFVNGGSLFQQSIVSSVDGAQFHNLANAIEACAGIVGATQIQAIQAVDVPSLTAGQIGGLTQAQMEALTVDQIAALTEVQIDELFPVDGGVQVPGENAYNCRCVALYRYDLRRAA